MQFSINKQLFFFTIRVAIFIRNIATLIVKKKAASLVTTFAIVVSGDFNVF